MSSSSKADEDPTVAVASDESTTETKHVTMATPLNSTSDEPANPALEEPDAMAIVQRGGQGTNSATAAAAANTAMTASVSGDRKQQLLFQARAERRKWVQQVPLPYASARDPNDLWSTQDRLHPVSVSLACQRVPAMTKVLSELYGLENHRHTPEEVAQRVDRLIQPFLSSTTTTNNNNTMNGRIEVDGEQLLEEALIHADGRENEVVLQAYYQFWTTLLKPECALLIQGMRNFLGNLQEDATTIEKVATSLKNYVNSTMGSTLKSHPAWGGQNLTQQQVKRSLESFLYGQAQTPILDRLEWTGLFAMKEDEWMERLTQLQFVQPKHLEIQCLTTNQKGDESSLDELLQNPIKALLSIDQYYSPYEKLQRILRVYQGVNAALSEALNHQQNNSSSSSERKLPSADDVLPTIILTVLRAKPHRLLRNLQMIEAFAPQEYLRGEAGYAYTNLYGAVQFLQDLNMDQPDSLSISPEEFRKGLEESVSKTHERLSIGKAGSKDGTDADVGDEEAISTDISVWDVRQARLNGETIDLEWAIKHQKDYPEKYGLDGSKNTKSESTAALPDGFSRSYGFLSATPQDIRLSDLPKLLSEYKMMVHVTEQLLGERGARVAMEKKKRETKKSRQLDDSFYGVGSSSDRRERSLTS